MESKVGTEVIVCHVEMNTVDIALLRQAQVLLTRS